MPRYIRDSGVGYCSRCDATNRVAYFVDDDRRRAEFISSLLS
ncbi:hypothetical protein HSB1_46450 [Halogranum salarium B-1]|uniref:Uncharacterized protein n=1 Tax=Halogranum salarium B-1 TaxID=1210908 RepID=J3JD80_9EURY|nr:hypothetical protein HSB1_46450 [Halogranum salarium B-1]